MKLNQIMSVGQVWQEKKRPNVKILIDKIDKTHVYFTIDGTKDTGMLSKDNFSKVYERTKLN
jgi:hypothetical protein